MPTKIRTHLLMLCLIISILPSCKTAEFESVPDTRSLESPVPEPTDEAAKDPLPAEVPPRSPLVESQLNPLLTELDVPTEERTETFFQEDIKAMADILIVIDDSQSMREEQENLSTKLDALLDSLKTTDWQIGVITTSVKPVDSGYRCELQLIRSTDADANDKFLKAVNAGTGGSGTEQGILQSVVGLRCPETPWVREKSTVAVLIVSDEDNCSNGEGCPRSPGKSERYLIDYVEKDLGRVVGMNAGFYGIYSPPGDVCKGAAAPANIYQNLVRYRAGDQKNFGRICDASYQSTLERISRNIASLLKKTFELKETPIAGSVRIEGKTVKAQAISPSDFDVMGRLIGFPAGKEPMPNSEIRVSYRVPAPR